MTANPFLQALFINHLRSPLPPLMEESPPPVPPKDFDISQPSMDSARPTTASAPASGSKRKRGAQDEAVYALPNARPNFAEMEHTPKRSRSSHIGANGSDISDSETPIQQRSVRRRKAVGNLSRMNLHHSRSTFNVPQLQESPIRESKFQEGSLTDKPSEKPPSVFTRIIRTDSGNLQHVEGLMDDYHDQVPTPTGLMQTAVEKKSSSQNQRMNNTVAPQEKEEGSGMFRFGKSLASAFHPVALWNRLWNEQKAELTREHLAEVERKAKLKEEAEAKYAEMKSAGQLGLQPVSLETPYDSAIALNTDTSDQEHLHTTSQSSMFLESQDGMASHNESEVLDSATRPLHSIRSRLHLRKPSFQDLKQGLKRVRSDLNLGGAGDRESSSSASPSKTDFENSALKKSHSKFDLKKQHKLSKRVSDLEAKLMKARNELDAALVQASPMPNLGGRHERFTPSGTARRSKFFSGAMPTLPTLPSEGVLFPSRPEISRVEEARVVDEANRTRPALGSDRAFDQDDDENDDEETVRASRATIYPTRASDIFKTSESDDNHQSQTDATSSNNTNINTTQQEDAYSELTELTDMDDPNHDTSTSGSGALTNDASDYNALDAKLRNLEANRRLASKKASKSKKRPSINDDEAAYRPGADEDEDDEWPEAAQKKKKRKSIGNTDASRNTGGGTTKRKSPASKIPTRKTKSDGTGADGQKLEKQADVFAAARADDVETTNAHDGEVELPKIISPRLSIASRAESLEPLYEEEEETTTVPLNEEPSKPTAKATPARFGRSAVHSQTRSPHKRSGSVPADVAGQMMAGAAQAARHSRISRTSSPPPPHGVATNVINDTVSIVPGEGGVPKLPVGVHKQKLFEQPDENYEWPDDVF